MSDVPFVPWGSRVVVKPDERPEEATSSKGIIILSGFGEASDRPMTTGTIVAVGNALVQPTDYLDVAVEVGTRVVYSPWSGFKMSIGSDQYMILDVSEILGNLEREEAVDVS
jgi:co-chaperonin GroES (HSP10)